MTRLVVVVLILLSIATMVHAETEAAAPYRMAIDADPATGSTQTSRSVSGTGVFNVAISVELAPRAYKAYQWQMRFETGGLEFVGLVSNNSGATGLDTCAPPVQTTEGQTVVGGGAGCISLNDGDGSTFIGDVAIVAMRCRSDGTHSLQLDGLNDDPLFGSVLSDRTGGALDTETVGAQISCSDVGGGADPGDCAVASVEDGDSFTCADGRRVNMRQIDAPELGQCGGGWGRAALQFFLPVGRLLRLEYDTTRTDASGAQLAAPIWRGNDGADYNLSIVLAYVGLAKAANYGDGNVALLEWATAAQTWASVAKWNMWAPNKTFTGGCD